MSNNGADNQTKITINSAGKGGGTHDIVDLINQLSANMDNLHIQSSLHNAESNAKFNSLKKSIDDLNDNLKSNGNNPTIKKRWVLLTYIILVIGFGFLKYGCFRLRQDENEVKIKHTKTYHAHQVTACFLESILMWTVIFISGIILNNKTMLSIKNKLCGNSEKTTNVNLNTHNQ